MAQLRLALAAAVLGFQLVAPAAAAERLKFDFSWRFFLGDVPGGASPAGNCSASDFRSTGSQTCGKLTAVPAAKTKDACVAACCAMGPAKCEVWQLSGDPEEPYGSDCWVGTCDPTRPLHNTSHGGWQGGARGATPAPAPGPAPPVTTGPASAGYDDTAWASVNAPHDYIIGLPYVANAASCSKSHGCTKFKDGFFPRSNGFYRKHFRLPASWADEAAAGRGSTFRLVFEGVYKVATVWVNGHYIEQYGDSSAAYTSFVVPLDAAHGLDLAGSNVIAIHVDGSYGTEHWYVGAGIYRHVWLESMPPVHAVDNGVFAPVTLAAGFASGVVTPSVELVNQAAGASGAVVVRCTLYGPDGHAVGSSEAVAHAGLPPHTPTTVKVAAIHVEKPLLWSIRTPVLYHMVTIVTAAQQRNDTINTTLGFRDLQWDYADGLKTNGKHTKIRGFCNHNDFTGVGMAIPERINLFRVQALRGVGGNAWRMSHNPYRDTLYDTMDRLGVMVWDETRDLEAPQLPAFGQMVRQHRNHPSVCRALGDCTALAPTLL